MPRAVPFGCGTVAARPFLATAVSGGTEAPSARPFADVGSGGAAERRSAIAHEKLLERSDASPRNGAILAADAQQLARAVGPHSAHVRGAWPRPGVTDLAIAVGYVDEYDDTYFNHSQMRLIIPELQRLGESAAPHEAETVRRLLDLARMVRVPDQMIFIGD